MPLMRILTLLLALAAPLTLAACGDDVEETTTEEADD